jgi:PhnB protein
MSTQNNNNTVVQPYLTFSGRCDEAVEFYRRAIGAEVTALIRFKDSPQPPPPGVIPENWNNKVMHASLRIGSTEFMASDGCSSGKPGFEGFSLSLSLPTVDQVKRAFAALSDGGQVKMPLNKTFFSASFGTLTDRFGVSWLVLVTPQPQPDWEAGKCEEAVVGAS